jgi:hypothetical protein
VGEGPYLVVLEAGVIFFSPVQVDIKLTNQVRLHILSYKKKRGKSADQVRLYIPSNSRRSGRGAWPGSLGC